MSIESIFDKISPFIPEEHANDFINMICSYEDKIDQIEKNKFNKKIPPATLRFNVTSRPFSEFFLRSGEITVNNLHDALNSINKTISDFENILEFGCGCGRLVLWLETDLKKKNFHGTDINSDAIGWCQQNFEFGKFTTNNPLPPLTYEDNMFDFVYCYSVFTHLNENDQFAWLTELQRITKKDGIILLTIRGQEDYEKRTWDIKDKEELNSKGFLFRKSNLWKGIFPDRYQNAYHTKKYIEKKYSNYFEILKYIEKGHETIGQDMLLLKNSKN